MSTNLPSRATRIPALRRQCLFQRCQTLPTHTSLSTPPSRAFSYTPTRCRAGGNGADRTMTRTAARQQVGQAPRVQHREAAGDVANMAMDIGLLQDTMIRAPFSKLPQPWTQAFWGYFWKLFKTKVTGLYSRSSYSRMISATRHRWSSYLPIDSLNNTQLKAYAMKYYEQVYGAFAEGNMQPIRRFCLEPLARDFEQRIAARPKGLKMTWKFSESNCSARVVSHRVSAMGEDISDTAYRQAVIRLKSKQALTIDYKSSARDTLDKSGKVRSGTGGGLAWVPAKAYQTQKKTDGAVKEQPLDQTFADNGKTKTVVEYIVLQKRVVNGKEEADWKVQGFAQESTPERLEEDAEYWRKTLSAQAEAAV